MLLCLYSVDRTAGGPLPWVSTAEDVKRILKETV